MFSTKALDIAAQAECERIEASLRHYLRTSLRKKGVVVGVSGGVDSSVCLALAVQAIGPSRVLALLMPEHDSSPSSLTLGRGLCEQLGVERIVEDISAVLEAQGCYQRRDEAIRSLIPHYDSSYRQKIILPQNLLDQERLNCFHVVVQAPDGQQTRARLPLNAFLQIVAATNMKQRTRKGFEYYHADRKNYAVIGTPNRLEYDQGFFVKNGDGAADIKPIAHLYKTQVYQLAHHLGLPEEICSQVPSTDTYSLPQTQEEFYFCLPYDRMDLMLYAHDHKIPPEEAGPVVDLDEEQVKRVYRDIEAKRRTTRYQHLPPLLVEEVESVVYDRGGKLG